jgi:hypothetical protein
VKEVKGMEERSKEEGGREEREIKTIVQRLP